jgi:hypothetical protein
MQIYLFMQIIIVEVKGSMGLEADTLTTRPALPFLSVAFDIKVNNIKSYL